MEDTLSFIQLFGEVSNYRFFKLKKSVTNTLPIRNDILFSENFALYETKEEIQRSPYNIWDVFGDVGGII
jgi:hypothetical protein